ncbi:hypothetical protein NP236_23495, partial [Salmonella enterica]|nr:hypothetical protein [Salmonella enterica]
MKSVTVGCLATDFMPSPVTFSWKFKNNTGVDRQSVHDFPNVLRNNGKYLAMSRVLLPSADALQVSDEYLVCNSNHKTGNKDVQVPLRVAQELPPNVSVFIPPHDSFSGSNPRKSQLICQASGFSPRAIAMSWLYKGQPVEDSRVSTSPVEVEPQDSGPATFRVISRLTVTESEWISQSVFTCQAVHNGLTFQKNVSSTCSPSPASSIEVFVQPPSFVSIFLTQSAQLTCLVTNLATYDSLIITWTRENGERL